MVWLFGKGVKGNGLAVLEKCKGYWSGCLGKVQGVMVWLFGKGVRGTGLAVCGRRY